MKGKATFFMISVMLLLVSGAARGQSCVVREGSLAFGSGSAALTPEIRAALDALATDMSGGSCRVVISGTGGGSTKYKSKAEQRSWERINAVIDYMSEHNKIPRERFYSNYGGSAARDHLTFREAGKDETGRSREDEPHPELRSK